MAEATQMITTLPIMNIVSPGEKPGELQLSPVFAAKVHSADGGIKTIFTQYTFGTAPLNEDGVPTEQAEFENFLGHMKLTTLASLCRTDRTDTLGVYVHIVRHTVLKPTELQASIEAVLHDAPDKCAILFVWPKAYSSETPFYQALGLISMQKDGNPGVQGYGKPQRLEEFGMTMADPDFMELSEQDFTAMIGDAEIRMV